MKRYMNTLFILQACIAALFSLGSASCDDSYNIIMPPADGGGGGTIAPSPIDTLDYKVWINGTEIAVDEARVQDAPFTKEKTGLDFGGNYAFASFDVDKSVEVKIESKGRMLANAELQSLADNSVSGLSKEDHSLSFRMDKPMQLIIAPDGKRSPLLLFANPKEKSKPDKNDPNVIYYGPGEHRPETPSIVLKDNQTLYLDEGAVLYAEVRVEGQNVTVCGRGTLCGDDFYWTTHYSLCISQSSHVVVKDIVIKGSSHWTIPVRYSKDVHIENVKICGGRVQNDDGIDPVNCQDVHIRNCFIRTDDDCIAVKGLDKNYGNVEKITVENSILWCDRARVILMGHESRAPYMRDITFKNIFIPHYASRLFLLEPGEEMKLENVLFEDFKINGEGQSQLMQLFPTVNEYMVTKSPGYINNIRFKNIEVTGKPGPYKIMVKGSDEIHDVRNVKIENTYILGNKVDKNYSYLEVGKYVSKFNLWDGMDK